MAKKTKRRQKTRKKSSKAAPEPPRNATPSGSTAEAVTVGWMLCLLTTLATEVAGVGARMLHAAYGGEKLSMLSGLLLVGATISGLILLILTPITIKLRPDPPPQPLVVCAVLTGIVPIVTVAILIFR